MSAAQSIFDQLKTLGAVVGDEEFIDTDFNWTPEEGADPVKFEISVKKEMTTAEYEYINFGGIGQEDPSVMARRVSRMVRIRSIGGMPASEPVLSEKDAKRLRPDLILAFVMAMNAVEEKLGKPVGTKADRPKK